MVLRLDDPRHLWRRYALALLLVVTLLGASHWASLRALDGGEEAASVINISGRQRMLSQRILYLSTETLAREEGSAADPRLAEAIALFERSHVALSRGGDLGLSREGAERRAPVYLEPLDGTRLDSISYFASGAGTTLDAMTEDFIASARLVAEGRGTRRDGAWEKMRLVGPGALLTHLNDAVGSFEAAARDRSRAIRRVSQATFALALAVLAAEALLIFWPAQRMVARSVGRLQRANASLGEALEGEREARGEALRAMRVRERFLANMSHEVRTPLNGVLGMLQLLKEGRLDAEARSRVGVAQASADHLLEVLGGVLELSRIESGEMATAAVPYDPAAVAAEAVAALGEEARDKDLSLRLEPTGPLPAVMGDPARLRQMLLQLVGNAVKFTEAGSVVVAMRHEAGEAAEGGRLRIEVRDTGPGVPPEERERLFERFEQGDGSATRRHGGAGLGLAICRQLAALMGGRIGVEGAPRGGSVFWIEIPAPPPGDAAPSGERDEGRPASRRPRRARADLGRPTATPAPASAAAVASAPAGKALRVLVAEDNRVNRLVAETFLRKLGHQVRCVADGAMAVEAVEAAFGGAEEGDRIDVVLMDVQMPVLDGLQATRAIRALGGPAALVPIVALTANAMEGDGERIMAAGDGRLHHQARQGGHPGGGPGRRAVARPRARGPDGRGRGRPGAGGLGLSAPAAQTRIGITT